MAVKEISSPLFVGWQRWRWFSFFGCFLPLVASAGDEVEWILVLQGGSGEILVLLGFPREVGWGPSVGLRMDLVRVGREFAGSLVGFCEGIWDSWPARSLLHLCEGMVASSHPHGGMWILAVSFCPGGGGCFRRTSMEKMPMFVQSFRCGLVVVPSQVALAASHVWVFFVRALLEKTVAGGEQLLRRGVGWIGEEPGRSATLQRSPPCTCLQFPFLS